MSVNDNDDALAYSVIMLRLLLAVGPTQRAT